MNDPNKAINVNLSSLLSLKAELLRKQAEVSKAKTRQTVPPDEYIANANANRAAARTSEGQSYSSRKDEKKHHKEIEKSENATVYEHEDSALLEKSQRVLEAKSKFYDRMTKSGGKLNSDDNCLVLFNRKLQEEKQNKDEQRQNNFGFHDDDGGDSDTSSVHSHGSIEGQDTDSDDEWVEYTDCLGRTRKCLRKDLESAKKRDAELAASMPERLDQSKANWMIDTKGSRTNYDNDDDDDMPIGPLPSESLFGDGCSAMSKHDEQRANWDRKEQENLEKKDVHYQDVFFDEARQHGVGYYAFSTDEEERQRQQRELAKARQQTIEEQKQRDTIRAIREKIIAERVRAAKNRQRARLGLPPLEEEEEQEEKRKQLEAEAEQQQETKEERKERKRAEKLKRKQEKEEQQRELERQQHIRPWDKNKDGMPTTSTTNDDGANEKEAPVEWVYKPERLPMSQEEWNEKKRAERNPEFAPFNGEMQTMQPKRTNFTSMPPPRVPPQSGPTRGYNAVTPPTAASASASSSSSSMPLHHPTPNDFPAHSFVNFQSTKRNKTFQRRSYKADANAGSISSNWADRGDVAIPPPLDLSTGSISSNWPDREGGAAIPPPLDLSSGYNLPPHAKKSKSSNELERSIEAGLRFLRDNCDKDTKSTKSSWTARADY